MNNLCETCDHKKHPDGGHCYMFREEPEFKCMQHTDYSVVIFTGPALGNTQMQALITELSLQFGDSAPRVLAGFDGLRRATVELTLHTQELGRILGEHSTEMALKEDTSPKKVAEDRRRALLGKRGRW